MVDKSNRPIIVTMLTIKTVLQTNQNDLVQSLCELLQRYCRQIKHAYYSHCANYYNGIVDKSKRSSIVTVLTIRTVLQTNETFLLQSLCKILERFCRQIKQTYYSQCINYQIGLTDKSNRPIIVTLLTIRTVSQTSQKDLLKSLCYLLERYCKQITQTYYSQCANYQIGLIDKSNRPIPIIVTVLTIITVLQTSQKNLLQSRC